MRRARRQRGAVAVVALITMAGSGVAVAAIQGGGSAKEPLVLIGLDDDFSADTLIQPPGTASDQSTRKADTLGGGQKSDLIIGRLGPDVVIAGPGDDVIVGGLEAGSDTAAFPAFDQALGGPGNDVFLWAPGDGSDAFTGGEEAPTTTVTRRVTRTVVRNGRRVRVTTTRRVEVPSPPDDDILIFGHLAVSATDNSLPVLNGSRFGPLPRANVSGVGLPATIGNNPPLPTVRGFCEPVPATPVSGWDFFVRFRSEATGAILATIRTARVERILCRTRGQDTISEFRLGKLGGGPVVERAGFTPPAGSRVDLLVD